MPPTGWFRKSLLGQKSNFGGQFQIAEIFRYTLYKSILNHFQNLCNMQPESTDNEGDALSKLRIDVRLSDTVEEMQNGDLSDSPDEPMLGRSSKDYKGKGNVVRTLSMAQRVRRTTSSLEEAALKFGNIKFVAGKGKREKTILQDVTATVTHGRK